MGEYVTEPAAEFQPTTTQGTRHQRRGSPRLPTDVGSPRAFASPTSLSRPRNTQEQRDHGGLAGDRRNGSRRKTDAGGRPRRSGPASRLRRGAGNCQRQPPARADHPANDGQYFVEDLHSRNGTFVNGQLIAGRKLLARRRPAEDLRSVVHLFRQPAERPTARLDRRRRAGLDVETTRTPALGHFLDHVEARRLVEQLRRAADGQPRSQAAGHDRDRPEPGQGGQPGRSAAKLLDSLFKIFLQADRGFVILEDSRRRAGAQGGQASPRRRRRTRSASAARSSTR